jgi:hypothetical protein
MGPVSSVGITAGFDWNTKNDPATTRACTLARTPMIRAEYHF